MGVKQVKMHLILLLLIETFESAVTLTVSDGQFQEDTFNNARVILAQDKIGPKMCVQNCMMISTCQAINYFQSELNCEFLQVVQSTNALQYKEGLYFTERTKWIRVCYK